MSSHDERPGVDRIPTQPIMLGGKPTIRAMRLSVQRCLGTLADQPSWDDLRADYPDTEPEETQQALASAAARIPRNTRGLLANLFVTRLPTMEPDLLDGAIISVGERGARVGRLPIG